MFQGLKNFGDYLSDKILVIPLITESSWKENFEQKNFCQNLINDLMLK